MENNGFIGIPIGGVIPWLGEAYGIELPDNFAILDGIITNTLPTESPFYGLTDILPDMDNLTFHCVEGGDSVGIEQGDNTVSVSILAENLPTDYGYECVNGTYSSVENYDLDEGTVSAVFGTTELLSASRYFGKGTIGLDNTNDSASGSGDGYLEYNTSATAYNSTFSHRHYANVSHTHTISKTSTSYTDTGEVSWGYLSGSDEEVSLTTGVNDLSRASCYFVIRLW